MPSTPPAVPASPLRRAVTAAGSLTLLVGLVAGLPGALTWFAGNPLPDDRPTVEGIGSALTSPDDGTLFLGLLAVIGWLAWACFTGTVAVEVLARLRHRATPAIPGLRGPQRFASVLVAAVAALAASPTFTSASAAMVQAPAPMTAPANPAETGETFGAAPQAAPQASPVRHLVERGEALLDLQDRYGVPWQRIAEANYGVPQPDGRSLQKGQTRIYPGWQLRIPAEPTPETATPETPRIIGLGAAETEAGRQPEYEVAEDDWLWYVADRYLGDPERYREIAALNPELADRHGDFPDHLEPGWTVTLPERAVDSGPTEHATGTATPAPPVPGDEPDDPPEGTTPEIPADEQPVPPPAQPSPTPPEDPAPEEARPDEAVPDRPDAGEPAAEGPAGQEPAAVTGFGEAPERPDEQPDDAAGASDEPDLERLAPAALAAAGLVAALVLGTAALHRHRRNQHHQPGFRFASPAARRLETALRSAQQPLDAARLDAALRGLAAGLAGRTHGLPDIAGVLVADGAVHLLLASPCPDPPPPWRDHKDRWTLPAGAVLPAPTGAATLAPLPALAAFGSQAGIHLLLDLERLGFLTIHGDQTRARDLLRYLAAELACNTWSDTAELLLVGFDPGETELLATLNPDRVRALPTVHDAVLRIRHRIGSARATLDHTGAADAFAGRIHGAAGDAWMPQILLAATRSPTDLAALDELARGLGGTRRCAVAVATAPGAVPPPPDQVPVMVTPDGTVQVRLPFLQASLPAASLPVAELATLAETVRAARTEPQVRVPPAPEPDPWAAGADAAGAAHAVGRATVGTEPPTVRGRDGDPSLDEDLRAWYADDQATRPRICILGPVSVDAPGTAPQTRQRLHAELIVFLAQRAGRGAQAPLIDAALWPDRHVTGTARQLAISRARLWLGTAPDGTPWLPDLGPDLAYRLTEGYLFDWHLFRRLRTRGETRAASGAADLRAALGLVRGVPLDGVDRPRTPGTRNPYPWLSISEIHPTHLVATIVDTAHQLAELSLAAGDPEGARWAVWQAWLADPDRSYDQPWRDLLRAEHADGRTDQLRAVLAELMEARDAEAPEDLAPDTYHLISHWPPNVLVPMA